jgi:hypothetical protein
MKKSTPIDVDLLNEFFRYENGNLIRKVTTSSRAKAGDVVGYLHHSGYLHVRFNNSCFSVSRLIYALHFGDPGDLYIDHINHIKDDNRIDNLRAVTHYENTRNQRKCKSNATGFTGVQKRGSRYRSCVTYLGKKMYLGTFDTPEEADKAVNAVRLKLGFHPNHGV